MFLLFVYTSKMFCTSYTPLYIHRYIFTNHLKMTEVWSKRRILPLIFTVKSFTKSILIIIGFAKLLLWFCSFQITRCKTLQTALMFKQTSDIDNDGGEKLDNDDDDDDDPYLYRST